MTKVPITAIITAYQRTEQTLETIRIIRACEPSPDEILVHVDANQKQCEAAIRQGFPDGKILLSEECVGPGGGRNRLIATAKNEFVASFDDDSYPIDANYFGRALALFEKFPAATILCAAVYHQGQVVAPDVRSAEWVSDFSGCACIYRRSDFLATSGYIPLPIAYGMEEVDLALRLQAQGGRILKTCWLRVFHDTDLKHHENPEVTAASIANLALLTYLRYPATLWLIGLGQCCKRIFWLLRHRRWRGILRGIGQVPNLVQNNAAYRGTVSASALKSYLRLRKKPVNAGTIETHIEVPHSSSAFQ
jgi:GT2 family glycosyltransferase